jgi:hypothetical protein
MEYRKSGVRMVKQKSDGSHCDHKADSDQPLRYAAFIVWKPTTVFTTTYESSINAVLRSALCSVISYDTTTLAATSH